MDSSKDLSNGRIPFAEVLCPNCGAKLLVPKYITIETIVCPYCCPLTPCP